MGKSIRRKQAFAFIIFLGASKDIHTTIDYSATVIKLFRQQLDEMERLKRLILVGKTPLKECPPELYHHPVFVFWRMVNREVTRASKKRADAYYRKLKASQKFDHVSVLLFLYLLN